MNNQLPINDNIIQNKIHNIRGVQVMLDRDLAELYGVENRILNQAVKRNIERFPSDFMFQLSKEEFENWKSQNVISNADKMGLRKLPYAFTEQGVSMLSAVLKSDIAIEISIKTATIELEDGENFISIKAKNRFAFSDEVLIRAYKDSVTQNIYKPTLYLLGIGVSKYANPKYNLGMADKDAISIAKAFKAQEGKIYKKVVTKVLTNKKANSDNILDSLDWIDTEATSKDVVIIFVAGHGVNDDKGNYYFLSHDTNLRRLRRTAVKWTEIQDTINNLPSKVILLADTCHSGNIAGKRRDITSAVKSIVNSGNGSIIFTATTGSGYSYEQSSWGHGAFTLSLLEGLEKMKADYDKDGTITIKEIDLYITNRVKKLTNGKQKPTTIIPASVPDFAIGVK
jgi:hypothetical protein